MCVCVCGERGLQVEQYGVEKICIMAASCVKIKSTESRSLVPKIFI